MDVIDMHNHFIAPEIIDFLAREGKHFATRIVEREGRRFLLIQEKAMRPIDGPISNTQARIADMEREGVTSAGGFVRSVPDVSGRRSGARTRDRAGQQRHDGVSERERPRSLRAAGERPDAGSGGSSERTGARGEVGTSRG